MPRQHEVVLHQKREFPFLNLFFIFYFYLLFFFAVTGSVLLGMFRAAINLQPNRCPKQVMLLPLSLRKKSVGGGSFFHS